jgi:drug/metabolite transporter (DMT)-like permease
MYMIPRPRGAPALTASRVAALQMLVGTVFISFSAVFVKIANVRPTIAGFYRMFIGGLVLIVVVLVRRESLWVGWKPLLLAGVAGVFFGADLISWHTSIHYIGPGLATILANFQVFFLAGIGVVVFRERLTWRLAFSIVLAVTGLFLLVGVDWGGLDARSRTGVGLALFCAVMYTCYLLVLRRSQTRPVRLRPTANLAVISLITAAILGPTGYWFGEDFGIHDAATAWSLMAYGVLCQAMGWIVISWAVTRLEASRVGLLLLLQPALTFVWDIVLFDRPTTLMEIFGALLTFVAIYFGSTRGR